MVSRFSSHICDLHAIEFPVRSISDSMDTTLRPSGASPDRPSSFLSTTCANTPLTESSADVFAQEVDDFLRFTGAEPPKYVCGPSADSLARFDRGTFDTSSN